MLIAARRAMASELVDSEMGWSGGREGMCVDSG